MEVSLTTRQFGESTILAVAGEIDLASAPQLRARMIELISGGTRSLIIDLSPTEFIDSTGLGVLIGARRRLGEVGGQLVLVIPQSDLQNLFAATGLTNMFTIVESVPADGEH